MTVFVTTWEMAGLKLELAWMRATPASPAGAVGGTSMRARIAALLPGSKSTETLFGGSRVVHWLPGNKVRLNCSTESPVLVSTWVKVITSPGSTVRE